MMSVPRTPPELISQIKTPTIAVQYNSDPALNKTNTTEPVDNYFNITKRTKRTFGELNEQPGYSSEIKYMFEQLTAQQENKFESLNNTLATIISRNQTIQNSVDSLTAKHDDLQKKIDHLEQENNEYKKRVANLENRLDHLEKSVRCSTIEIRNLPKLEVENKKTLIDIIHLVGSTLGLETPIHQSEIRDIFRTKSEAVVVDFTTNLTKKSFLAKYKSYNKIRIEEESDIYKIIM
ncbi:unnamed protein product [Parnassius mnemosyne]|uniref:Uncharacterized protein n=1 Tax=Parnassius mnemosyne TaxID=213953 RepID=A0AAV1KIZ9_9NEOP